MDEGVRIVESAGLQLLGPVIVDECTFTRSIDLEDDPIEYQWNYDRMITKIAEDRYRVSLRCNIVEPKKNAVEIHARAVALFAVNAKDKKTKNILVSKNTVAILFPFVRSQVALVTAQSGLSQMTPPVVNIAEMFPDKPLPGESEDTDTGE